MTQETATVTLSFDSQNSSINVQWSFSHRLIKVGDSITMEVKVAEGSAAQLSNPSFTQFTYRDSIENSPVGPSHVAWPNGSATEMGFYPESGPADRVTVCYEDAFESDRRIKFTGHGTVELASSPPRTETWQGDPELTLKAGTPPADSVPE